MNPTRYLTLEDFSVIIEEYRSFFRDFDDPLPDLKLSNSEKLDSIISIPQKTFGGNDLYVTVYEKGVCYFYFINKLHPFYNGNKRISIFVTSIFFMMNNFELTYSDEELYRLAHTVTINHSKQDEEVRKLSLDFQRHTRPVTDPWMYFKNTWVLVSNLFQNIKLQGSFLARKPGK